MGIFRHLHSNARAFPLSISDLARPAFIRRIVQIPVRRYLDLLAGVVFLPESASTLPGPSIKGEVRIGGYLYRDACAIFFAIATIAFPTVSVALRMGVGSCLLYT